MARSTYRVEIPTNADNLIELGENIVSKHEEDPTTSPLSQLDMTLFRSRVDAARDRNTEAKKLRRDSETATESRNGLLGTKHDQTTTTPDTLLNFVTRARDILKGHYKGAEQHLGDHGFTVDTSPRQARGNGGDITDPVRPNEPEPPIAP